MMPMSHVAYVDGQYMPHRSAAVHIVDRGYQFATGDYEVLAVVGGQLVDAEPHLVRLASSLSEPRIAAPISDTALKIAASEAFLTSTTVKLVPVVRIGGDPGGRRFRQCYLAHDAAAAA
jgi:branched-subunit amino acid aminotransferase/4-amino-4-deoxychorismate lyase